MARYRAEAAREPAGETVDVSLPSCGEPLAVLDNTFRHVSALTWHGTMTVYALDDSAREDVRDLADRYGFRYVVRPRPGEMKKAGNLTHALGISTGDFIAVIDADFAVRPEFLYETMPYFDDPKVGIVQTAQYYDVSDRSFSYIQRYAGTLQEIFFRFIQPARDRYKAAICAGTNLVYRRAAVRAAGGFAQVPIGEDVHSGVKLWWAGFQTRYLPLCLAKGVAPTDFPSLANQQARWCRSSMMLMTERHFVQAPFTWRQRTAFWAAFLYYMSSAALLLTGPFPTLTMIWCYPGRVYPHNYLPILPALAASLFAYPVLSRGWRPTIYRVCLINSCCHLYSVWYAIRGRVAEWVPTGASPDRGAQVPGGGQPDPVHLDRRRAGTPLGGPGPEGAPVRLAPVLGHGNPGRHPALHDGAADDTDQGRLEAGPAEGGNSMTRKGRRRQVREVRNTGTRRWWIRTGAAVIAAAAIAAGIIVYNQSSSSPTGPLPVHLPPVSGSYLGVYTPTAPRTYTGVTAFRNATGTRPERGHVLQRLVPVVPGRLRQDGGQRGRRAAGPDGPGEHQRRRHRLRALRRLPDLVRRGRAAYHYPVIVSFGHEMNGDWYSWGYKAPPPPPSSRPGGTSSACSARSARRTSPGCGPSTSSTTPGTARSPARPGGGRAGST